MQSMLNSLQNGRCNLYQETVPLLQSIFTCLFYPYLFAKSSLQFPLTLPSYITQKLFTSFFLRTTIPTIYTKNILPTSNSLPIQAASSYQEVREYCEDWHCLIFPFFLKMWRVIAGLTLNHWIFIAKTQKIYILQVLQTFQPTFSHTVNLFSLLSFRANTRYKNSQLMFTTRTHVPLESSCLIWFSS